MLNEETITTVTTKAEIAKRAIDHGITDTVRHYASLYPERSEIPISSVATWKARYLKELKIQSTKPQSLYNLNTPSKCQSPFSKIKTFEL